MDRETVTPPETLHLEGGGVIQHMTGVRVFNYYDHKAGHIERTATFPEPGTMPVHDRDGGAWWMFIRHDDGSGALLDQSRLCTIDTAKVRGWI